MQTILGSNGQIGQELAKELHSKYTKEIRLVSRKPSKVNETDELVAADLLNEAETNNAVKGSEIVYFTAGLPMKSAMWEKRFPKMIKNVIKACEANQAKLVYFDNTYMYAKTDAIQTENSPFEPVGRKSTVRAELAEMILTEMKHHRLEAVICRAPEFYGPGKTQSITNTMIFNRIKAGKQALVPIDDDTLRTLIWTPDASRAMALIGNTTTAYGQTWHLPCAEPVTYRELIEHIKMLTQRPIEYRVVKKWQFKLGSLVNENLRELQELLPRYEESNRFSDTKFRQQFPTFSNTTIEAGIRYLFK